MEQSELKEAISVLLGIDSIRKLMKQDILPGGLLTVISES